MPTYEYCCNRCGHEFEAVQRINDAPVSVCPKCRKRSVRRLISRTSFVLKGGGWYVTDYARKPADGGSSTGERPRAETETAKKDDAGKPEAKKDMGKPEARSNADASA